jgi:hypothetical protein
MWAAVISSLVLSASPEMVARTLDGREVAGTVQELSGARVVIRSVDQSVTIEPEQLLSLTPKVRPAAPSGALPLRIELVDGSRIAASDFDVKDGQVTLTARELALTGSAKAVSVARFKPETQAAKAIWAGLLAAHKAKMLKGDVLVLAKGETVDSAEGVLHDTALKDGKKIIKFDHDETPIEVLFERVDGLIYLNVSEAPPADPVCVVADADGSQLRLKSIVLKEGRVEFETVGGFKGSRPIEQLALLDFSAGKVAYLGGDHEPDSDELAPLRKPIFHPLVPGTRPLPSVLEWGKPRSKNRVLQGDEFTLANKTYKRGLYLKGGWEIEYALRGQYRRFHSIVGVDDKIGAGAELVIEGDGKVLFKEVIQKQQPAKTLDLDVSGVRILKIRANRVQRVSGIGDGVIDLCEAKVSK